MFRKIGEIQDLEMGVKYSFPPGATHIGVRAGKIVFFKALKNNDETQKSFRSQHSHWRRYPVPEGQNISAVSFPYVEHLKSGWQYGDGPSFLS